MSPGAAKGPTNTQKCTTCGKSLQDAEKTLSHFKTCKSEAKADAVEKAKKEKAKKKHEQLKQVKK
ncbi:hypothetical protein ACP70R_016627 [Stipagrostis hirtigluma subsp. patula]